MWHGNNKIFVFTAFTHMCMCHRLVRRLDSIIIGYIITYSFSNVCVCVRVIHQSVNDHNQSFCFGKTIYCVRLSHPYLCVFNTSYTCVCLCMRWTELSWAESRTEILLLSLLRWVETKCIYSIYLRCVIHTRSNIAVSVLFASKHKSPVCANTIVSFHFLPIIHCILTLVQPERIGAKELNRD